METHPRKGVVKEYNFQTAGNPLTDGCLGNFGISEGNITGRGNTHTHTHTHIQNKHQTSTPSGEVAQMLASASSVQGLNKESQPALLRVRTGTECPEDNLRKLT